MIVRLDSVLCKVLLSKRMMWAWSFWYIEAVRVGQNYDGFVRIGLNTKARRKQNINWM
jgi:hypothetical protein